MFHFAYFLGMLWSVNLFNFRFIPLKNGVNVSVNYLVQQVSCFSVAVWHVWLNSNQEHLNLPLQDKLLPSSCRWQDARFGGWRGLMWVQGFEVGVRVWTEDYWKRIHVTVVTYNWKTTIDNILLSTRTFVMLSHPVIVTCDDRPTSFVMCENLILIRSGKKVWTILHQHWNKLSTLICVWIFPLLWMFSCVCYVNCSVFVMQYNITFWWLASGVAIPMAQIVWIQRNGY